MVVHAYFPTAEPRVQREAAAARDAGFDVTVLALGEEGRPSKELVDGVRVRRFPLTHRRGAGFGRILFEYLAFCLVAGSWLALPFGRRRFDIVHFHGPPDFVIMAGVVPKIMGAKLILDIHDLSSHMFAVRVPGRLGAVASRMLVWVERLCGEFANAVITVHEPYRQELRRHGTSSAKLSVVMNSVDEAVLRRARTAASWRQHSRRFTIAYHGTLTSWYGVDLIVDAVRYLRESGCDVDSVILGAGDAVPSLRAKVAEAGLGDYVYLPGRYVPIEEALATVTEASCGVIPNRPSEINRFALSSKLFEYVALGVPVVVARLETLAGHFDSDEVTFFEPGDAASLSSAIRWVHDNPTEARAKAQRARIRAKEYSWSRCREQLCLVYERLLGTELPEGAGPGGGARTSTRIRHTSSGPRAHDCNWDIGQLPAWTRPRS